MTDLLVAVGLIVFFALCVGFVAVCARIIGPDPEGVRLSIGGDAVDLDVVDDVPVGEEVAVP